MTNFTLSSILAAAALVVAAAGVVSSVPEGPVNVSINGLGGLELTPVTQSVVASASDPRY